MSWPVQFWDGVILYVADSIEDVNENFFKVKSGRNGIIVQLLGNFSLSYDFNPNGEGDMGLAENSFLGKFPWNGKKLDLLIQNEMFGEGLLEKVSKKNLYVIDPMLAYHFSYKDKLELLRVDIREFMPESKPEAVARLGFT